MKYDKGTAAFPKAKDYQKMKVARIKWSSEDESGSSLDSDIAESEGEESEHEETDDEDDRKIETAGP
jgi:hypothetical protein